MYEDQTQNYDTEIHKFQNQKNGFKTIFTSLIWANYNYRDRTHIKQPQDAT